MLGDISGLEKIYIVCGYTDMRKSIDGLCTVIEDQLKMDPSSSALFLFCGRRRDRIKALFREPDGFVLSAAVINGPESSQRSGIPGWIKP